MQDYEKLGVFYLGREKDGDLLLYNSKHLTTHAMIVGMTGSGKTGLALAMIEEAAIDGIPAILIDPKGDLANILLQFPELRPSDFRPWIDSGEASRNGVSPDEMAEKTAAAWKKGLEDSGQSGERIRMLSQSADFAVYTPGDTSGRPLQILRSFDAPQNVDELTLRDSILNNVSSLLGLVGITADPVQSREHILLSSIFYFAWKAGRNLSLEDIISSVAKPPFEKIGVFDLESFYPQKDRMKLAMSLNSLLASPGFAAWREGEPLDIARLLHTPEGKPRISVLSIAHLSDSERMFFVTAVLNEMISWMRRQTGTGSLRALLYMDEIFGYFPPTANPPSKAPMLTLLKQARAFGLGIALSTQNPVDIDYKGLSNCGTWFIGRLQTDRDKQRVLDGLEGAAAANGNGFDRAAIDKMLSGLGKRVFMMRDVNDDVPVVFSTRWVMSYMCGPLSMAQIKSLGAGTQNAAAEAEIPAALASPAFPPIDTAFFTSQGSAAPAAAPAAAGMPAPATPKPESRTVAAAVRLHFVNAKTATDFWQTRYYITAMGKDGWPEWERAEETSDIPAKDESASHSLISEKQLAFWAKSLSSYIYQECSLTFWRDTSSKLISGNGESEGDFRVRVLQAYREKRDDAIEKLNAKYVGKIRTLEDKIRNAEAKLQREKAQVKEKTLSTTVWGAAAILGALFGRGISGSIGKAGSTVRSASKIGKEKQDVVHAEENLQVLTERKEILEKEFKEQLEAVQSSSTGEDISLESVIVRPRKTDIIVEKVYFAEE